MDLKSKYLKVCVLLSLQFFAGSAFADQEFAEKTQGVTDPDLAFQRVQEELEDVEWSWYGIGRFRYNYPLKFSAGFGAILVEQPRDTDCSTGCMVQGWQFEIEPGLYGIQGSVGWGRLVGETGRTKRWMHTTHFGWAIRGVLMRTWGDWRDTDTPVAKTLAGVEGSVSIVRLNFSLGLLRSLSSNASEDWVISAGAGFGF